MKKKIKVLLLPKETHPFERLRLYGLFQTQFQGIGNTIHWITQSRTVPQGTIYQENNVFHISSSIKKDKGLFHVINRVLSFLKFCRARSVIQTDNIDVILVNDGIIEGLIGFVLSRRYRIPLAYYLSANFFEVDEETYRENPRFGTFIKYCISQIMKYLYYYIISRSDIFHPISDQMMDQYRKKYPELEMFPLPLCPRSDFFNHNVKKVEEDIMIYVGKINHIRRLENLVLITEILKRNRPSIKLKIVGRVSEKSALTNLKKQINSLGLTSNVEILKEVPIEKIPEILSTSALGICILPPIGPYLISSPTKVVEYLSVGLPVVANSEIDDQKKVIIQSKGGLVTEYDVDKIAKCISVLLEDKDRAYSMGRVGKEWIRKNRNYTVLASELENRYEELLERRTVDGR